ncbi:MAG: histidine--tRNA ligase [Pseudomonadota bacterium]
MSKIQSVKGMNDLLPDTIDQWHRIESSIRQVAWQYGYQEIRTPILEKTELFKQSIGDQTDIVEKEMYTFADAGDVSLTMRPEATASTVRACNQHGLLHNQQQRLWYMGPMFRRERPQKGRYRQFHQFGIEAFGWNGPDIDAEIIQVGARLWKNLGIRDISLLVNTLGSESSRKTYRSELQAYLQRYEADLDADSRRRLHSNPLRVLDSKAEKTREILEQAPKMGDFLDPDALAHFEGFRGLLEAMEIPYTVDDRLVRGLDYYTSTVFEWVTGSLGAQSAVCAGGRYDNLVEHRGGKPTPAIGFAMGVERLIELAAIETEIDQKRCPDIYVIPVDAAQQSLAIKLAERLRDANLFVVTHCGGGKIRNQMKRADSSGATLTLMLGESEVASGSVTVKRMRAETDPGDASTAQTEIKLDDAVGYCVEQLARFNCPN